MWNGRQNKWRERRSSHYQLSINKRSNNNENHFYSLCSNFADQFLRCSANGGDLAERPANGAGRVSKDHI